MSGISYGDGATKRSIGSVFYQDGVTRRTIQKAWIGDGGVNRLVYSAYTPISNVTASPSSINRTTSGSGATAVATASLPTLSWSGGNPSPTQTWTVISGALVINSGQVKTSSAIANAQTVTGIIRGTVNDGTSSGSVDVPVSLSYTKVA